MSWAEDMRAVHAEAAGCMTLDIICPADVPSLVAYGAMGDQQAKRLTIAVEQALNGIARAPRRRPMLCASCPRPVRPGSEFWVVIASPARDDAAQCLTLAICAGCAMEREHARQKALVALRRVWPDARPIEVTHQVGSHA